VLFLPHIDGSGTRDSFLDLTKVNPSLRKELVLKDGGGVSGSHDTPFPTLPLEITLLSLDKSNYQIGEAVIYDVAIKNVGQDAVVIPWSPDRYQIRPDETYPSGYVSAILSLVITDKVLGEQIIYVASVYGSQRVPSMRCSDLATSFSCEEKHLRGANDV